LLEEIDDLADILPPVFADHWSACRPPCSDAARLHEKNNYVNILSGHIYDYRFRRRIRVRLLPLSLAASLRVVTTLVAAAHQKTVRYYVEWVLSCAKSDLLCSCLPQMQSLHFTLSILLALEIETDFAAPPYLDPVLSRQPMRSAHQPWL
jgi:hypothetical protein